MELWDTDRALLGESNEEPSRLGFVLRLVLAGGFIYAVALLIFSLEARADVLLAWDFVIAERPITATDCGTKISACHNSGALLPWHCYCPGRGK